MAGIPAGEPAVGVNRVGVVKYLTIQGSPAIYDQYLPGHVRRIIDQKQNRPGDVIGFAFAFEEGLGEGRAGCDRIYPNSRAKFTLSIKTESYEKTSFVELMQQRYN
jgi:hypothetical protein